jgi:TPR repeat protein
VVELGLLAEERGDLDEASAWYQKGADRVLAMAKHLDEMLELERRARNDGIEALKALRRIADAGDPRAMDWLGSLALGQGELDEALAWTRKAAYARSAQGTGSVGTADT